MELFGALGAAIRDIWRSLCRFLGISPSSKPASRAVSRFIGLVPLLQRELWVDNVPRPAKIAIPSQSAVSFMTDSALGENTSACDDDASLNEAIHTSDEDPAGDPPLISDGTPSGSEEDRVATKEPSTILAASETEPTREPHQDETGDQHAALQALPPLDQMAQMNMWVPADVVGAFIGRRGAVIRSLKNESKARVKAHKNKERDGRRLFIIVGHIAKSIKA